MGGRGQVPAAVMLVRVQRSRSKCAELRGCGLAARLMMLFAFPSFGEDRSGASTRGLLFFLTHRGARGGGGGAHGRGSRCGGGSVNPGDDDEGTEADDGQDKTHKWGLR